MIIFLFLIPKCFSLIFQSIKKNQDEIFYSGFYDFGAISFFLPYNLIGPSVKGISNTSINEISIRINSKFDLKNLSKEGLVFIHSNNRNLFYLRECLVVEDDMYLFSYIELDFFQVFTRLKFKSTDDFLVNKDKKCSNSYCFTSNDIEMNEKVGTQVFDHIPKRYCDNHSNFCIQSGYHYHSLFHFEAEFFDFGRYLINYDFNTYSYGGFGLGLSEKSVLNNQKLAQNSEILMEISFNILSLTFGFSIETQSFFQIKDMIVTFPEIFDHFRRFTVENRHSGTISSEKGISNSAQSFDSRFETGKTFYSTENGDYKYYIEPLYQFGYVIKFILGNDISIPKVVEIGNSFKWKWNFHNDPITCPVYPNYFVQSVNSLERYISVPSFSSLLNVKPYSSVETLQNEIDDGTTCIYDSSYFSDSISKGIKYKTYLMDYTSAHPPNIISPDTPINLLFLLTLNETFKRIYYLPEVRVDQNNSVLTYFYETYTVPFEEAENYSTRFGGLDVVSSRKSYYLFGGKIGGISLSFSICNKRSDFQNNSIDVCFGLAYSDAVKGIIGKEVLSNNTQFLAISDHNPVSNHSYGVIYHDSSSFYVPPIQEPIRDDAWPKYVKKEPSFLYENHSPIRLRFAKVIPNFKTVSDIYFHLDSINTEDEDSIEGVTSLIILNVKPGVEQLGYKLGVGAWYCNLWTSKFASKFNFKITTYAESVENPEKREMVTGNLLFDSLVPLINKSLVVTIGGENGYQLYFTVEQVTPTKVLNLPERAKNHSLIVAPLIYINFLVFSASEIYQQEIFFDPSSRYHILSIPFDIEKKNPFDLSLQFVLKIPNCVPLVDHYFLREDLCVIPLKTNSTVFSLKNNKYVINIPFTTKSIDIKSSIINIISIFESEPSDSIFCGIDIVGSRKLFKYPSTGCLLSSNEYQFRRGPHIYDLFEPSIGPIRVSTIVLGTSPNIKYKISKFFNWNEISKPITNYNIHSSNQIWAIRPHQSFLFISDFEILNFLEYFPKENISIFCQSCQNIIVTTITGENVEVFKGNKNTWDIPNIPSKALIAYSICQNQKSRFCAIEIPIDGLTLLKYDSTEGVIDLNYDGSLESMPLVKGVNYQLVYGRKILRFSKSWPGVVTILKSNMISSSLVLIIHPIQNKEIILYGLFGIIKIPFSAHNYYQNPVKFALSLGLTVNQNINFNKSFKFNFDGSITVSSDFFVHPKPSTQDLPINLSNLFDIPKEMILDYEISCADGFYDKNGYCEKIPIPTISMTLKPTQNIIPLPTIKKTPTKSIKPTRSSIIIPTPEETIEPSLILDNQSNKLLSVTFIETLVFSSSIFIIIFIFYFFLCHCKSLLKEKNGDHTSLLNSVFSDSPLSSSSGTVFSFVDIDSIENSFKSVE